jgi:photosystem II stability/assembly factor-like uncharacterized protein
MQKIILTAALCLAANGLFAQSWMAPFEGKERVKLQDVVDAHKASKQTIDRDEEEEEEEHLPKGVVKEKGDYQFDRWRWYWEQHLDDQGYMVSPLKNVQEWQAYKSRVANGPKAKTTGSAPSWGFVGPIASTANGYGLGRIQKVIFHPTDSNIYWAGTAGGGLWKTVDNGAHWTCLTDGLPVHGAADLGVNPRNPSVLYLCTGDRDGYDNSSIGLLKSTDGGATWDTTGFQFPVRNGARTNSVLINPLDTSTLLIASSTGIYQSRNGGATWKQCAAGSYRELVYRPGDTSIIYSTGISNAQIFRSADGGLTWAQVSSVTGTRVSIAVSAAAPNMVKAIFANMNGGLEGIYHSSDTGKTFTKIFNPASCSENYLANNPSPSSSNCSGQGTYDLAIAVSPLDSNRVVIGGINTWYSTNGGLTWLVANQWTSYLPSLIVIHADKHYMGFHPLRPTVFFEGNDGGLYRTSNVAAGWTDITNGMGITQFYRLAVANHSLFAIGGAQDNGSKRVTPGLATAELTGGDGMNCEIDPLITGVFYTSYQYGTIVKNNTDYISGNIPGNPTGGWITPYVLHPMDGAKIIAGYDKMYYSSDEGGSWAEISPAFSSQKILRVAFAPSNYKAIYAVSGNVIRRSLDLGVTWMNMTGVPGGSISDIIVDQKDKQHIWVTYSGYGVNKVAEYDTVRGWTTLNDTLPNVPVNCITIDTSNRTIYVGTDVAVFYRDTTMKTWGLWSANLPSAEVTDLGINYSTGEIWASTYGRGMWKSTKFDFPPGVGVSMVPFAADVITVSPNPSHGPIDVRTVNSGLIGQEVNVSLFDLSGRRIWSASSKFSASGSLNVNAGNLPPANYILDVKAANGMHAKTKVSVY